MTSEVPLLAVPSQILTVQLGNKSCRIRVSQKRTGLYVDVSVNGALVIANTLAMDRTWLVRGAHLGFPGDLAFIDRQGRSDPTYDGLGGRFRMVWRP